MNMQDNLGKIKGEIKFAISKKNYKRARVLIDEYLEIAPSDYYIQGYKVLILIFTRQAEEAKKLIAQILENPLVPLRERNFVLSSYAKLLDAENEVEDAINCYLDILATSNQVEFNIRCKLARLYRRLKKYDEALDILNVQDMNVMEFNVERAYIYNDIGLYGKALKALEEPISYDGKIYKEYSDTQHLERCKNHVLGEINYNTGHIDDALKYYNQVITSKVDYIYLSSLYMIALIKYRFSNINECIDKCRTILKNIEGDTLLNKTQLLLGKAYIKKNQIDKAQEVFDTCRDDRVKLQGKIRISYATFDFESCLKYLDEAMKNDVGEFLSTDLYIKAAIELRQGKYDSFYSTYNEYISVTNDGYYEFTNNLNKMKAYADFALGKDFGGIQHTYTVSQIIGYSKEEVIKHVVKNHRDNPTISCFNSDVDINTLYDEVVLKLNDAPKICVGLMDEYIINFNELIGHDINGNSTNKLGVVCLFGTNKIITMYPYVGDDVVKENEVIPSKKVKRLSAIEKFNKRYNI